MTVTWKKLGYDEDIWTTTAKARAYLEASQLNLTHGTWLKVALDTESFDPGSNFDTGNLGSGTADGTTANHLIDSGYDFAAAGIVVGERVENTTDSTYTYITAVAVGDLTLRDDIFVSGKGWGVLASRFVAPVAGYYSVSALAYFINVIADKEYQLGVLVNGTHKSIMSFHSALAANISIPMVDIMSLSADDNVTLWVVSLSGDNTVDLAGGAEYYTRMTVHFLSKA